VETNARILAAETIGTTILVLGGVGAAVLAPGIGPIGVAVAAGLSIMVAAIIVGHVSGAHLNPAVSIALVFARKVPGTALPFYLLGQLLGALIGALGVWGIGSGLDGFSSKNAFAQNGWGSHSPGGFGIGSVIVVEIVFTAIWVAVVLATEHDDVNPGIELAALGTVVAALHLVTGSIDNTGLNPVRALATAIFAGTDALGQVWLFILAPVVGAIVGVLVWLAMDDTRLEGTMLFNPALAQARDLADHALDEVVEEIEDIERR
jgi:aquaporin Z